MEEADVRIRNLTYARFVELGHTPTAADVAAVAAATPDEIVETWRRLAETHTLVLDADGSEIVMAHPFSAVPTPHRVEAAGRWWYANCGWDTFGVCAALHVDGHLETSCPDCGDVIAFDVRDGRPTDETLVFHCLVPASEWWDDIAFT